MLKTELFILIIIDFNARKPDLFYVNKPIWNPSYHSIYLQSPW